MSKTSKPKLTAEAQEEIRIRVVRTNREQGLSQAEACRVFGVGKTPVIPGTGQQFRCNMISTITNRGQLAFMMFTGRFTSDVRIKFLRRLTRHPAGRGFPAFLLFVDFVFFSARH